MKLSQYNIFLKSKKAKKMSKDSVEKPADLDALEEQILQGTHEVQWEDVPKLLFKHFQMEMEGLTSI